MCTTTCATCSVYLHTILTYIIRAYVRIMEYRLKGRGNRDIVFSYLNRIANFFTTRIGRFALSSITIQYNKTALKRAKFVYWRNVRVVVGDNGEYRVSNLCVGTSHRILDNVRVQYSTNVLFVPKRNTRKCVEEKNTKFHRFSIYIVKKLANRWSRRKRIKIVRNRKFRTRNVPST